MSKQSVLDEVSKERAIQDAQWGGAAHDDKHTEPEWIAILARHLGLAANDEAEEEPTRFRRQMVRLAAVAVAAVEAFDRAKGSKVAGPPASALGKGW